jgi:glycosyltransferase involved in cell wall biosynthesis
MKILLISPVVFPITPDVKYAGIERLVYQYAAELSKNNEVTVLGHSKSVYPEGVKHYGVIPEGDPFVKGELKLYQSYQYMLRGFDIIHDFSHSQFASRYTANLPSVNPFWHAPSTGKYPKSPYNIIALSLWAKREFKRVYGQDSKYVQSIVVGDEYKPGKRGERFLTLGKMSPEKGNLAAIMLCKEAGVQLDVVGGRGAENTKELSDYEKAVTSICDGKQIKFWGEVTDEVKIKLLQECNALIYALAPGYTEVTSHKVQEALLCGVPVITSPVGALPEIITNDIDGKLCLGEKDFIEAIKSADKLDALKTRESNAQKFSVGTVCAEYLELYKKIIQGERW